VTRWDGDFSHQRVFHLALFKEREVVGQRVGVFGATGYAGRELVRLLRRHPSLEVAFTTGSDGKHLAHEAGLEREAAAYFLALPHGVAAEYAARLRRERPAAVVVDLSGDLRLPSAESYRDWYGHAHKAPALIGTAPYGLTELNRAAISSARLVSNPGCYATSVLLPLAPLLRERMVSADDVIVDAKSGATGAGRTLRDDLLFCELDGDFSAYSPGRTHRHVGEVEAFLVAHSGATVSLTFCPHLLPVKRGILSALYLKTSAAADDVASALRRAYAGEPFVRVVDAAPKLSDVVDTNDCLLSVHAAGPGRVVVFSALDNLLKGASGQALQNLNLALGLEETAGLPLAEPAAVGALS
jgi:N-acetyl-gamma-glutamyl-phosphate reductase